MNTKLEKFDSGWVGVSLALSSEEVEVLIQRLRELKSGEINHFHLRNKDFTLTEGIADIEITTMGKEELDNMTID